MNSKYVEVGPAIDTNILAVMEGLKLAKVEGLSNLLLERDSATVLYRENKERSSRRFDAWLSQILYITLKLSNLIHYS